MTIVVDYTRNELLSEQAATLLNDYYCRDGEDPQDAYARAALAYCRNDHELAQRIYDYASKGWFMFSSPLLSNAPAQGEKVRGLPISCFLNYVASHGFSTLTPSLPRLPSFAPRPPSLWAGSSRVRFQLASMAWSWSC